MATIKEQLDTLNKSNKSWKMFLDIVHNIDIDKCEIIVIDTIS